jgi:uncharacterized caspase-like protein
MRRFVACAIAIGLGVSAAGEIGAQPGPSPTPSPAPPPTPHKYALLIGLNRYGFQSAGVQSLDFAKKDVDALTQALTRHGYEVVPLLDQAATRVGIMLQLSNLAAQVQPGDDFLLYYAGHGVRNKSINDKTYWLTYDTQLEALDLAGIRLPHLLDYVADIRAERKLVLLDHCFSGDVVMPPATVAASRGAPGGPVVARGPEDPGIARVERGVYPIKEFNDAFGRAGSGVILVGAARGAAFERPDLKHGLFTFALLQALNTREADDNNDAKLSVAELTNYLRGKVHTLSNGDQEIRELTTASDPAHWYVTDRLPVANAAEATEKAAAYQRTLSEWEQKGLITSDTKIRCYEVLQNWPRGLPPVQRRLSPEEQNLIGEIRAAMDNSATAAPERVRAENLNEFVKTAVEGGPS